MNKELYVTKISLIKSIFITLLLIIGLFLSKNFLTNQSYIDIIISLIYILLIFYCFKFNLSNLIGQNIYYENKNLPPVLIISGCMYLIIYFLPLLFNLLFFGKLDIEFFEFNIFWKKILFVIVIYPVLEEILFRNIILDGLQNNYTRKKALLLSSILFAITHIFTENGILLMFFSGLILGYVYLITKSIVYTIILHSTYSILVIFISPKINLLITNLNLKNLYIIIGGILIISTFSIRYSFQLLNSRNSGE